MLSVLSRVLVPTLIVAMVIGCSDDGRDLAAKRGQKPIVTVLGKTLVKADVERKARMLEAMIRHRTPKARGDMLEGALDKLFRRYPATFVRTAVLDDFAKKNKIVIPDEALNDFQSMAFRRYGGKNDTGFADMSKALGGFSVDLDEQVRSEALSRTVRDYWAKLYPTNIPDSYVDQQLENFRLYNENVIKTNVLVFARATNVWEQLKAGASFKKMAVKYTELDEDRETQGFWGAVDSRQLTDEPELIAWCKKLKVGEFSPPFEGDNGVMIIRLEDVQDEGREFHLSRIYFMLAESRTPASRERILQAAYEKYADRLFELKLTELIKAANPVFNKISIKEKEKQK